MSASPQKRTNCRSCDLSALCHVWAAPSWQDLSSRLPAGRCSHVFGLFARHKAAGDNALRGSGPGQKPAFEMHWHKWVVRSPDRPALHYVLLALPTFTSRRMSARSRSRRECDRFLVANTSGHHDPRHSCDLVGERDRNDLGGPPRQ
jgi:hypothetical protein